MAEPLERDLDDASRERAAEQDGSLAELEQARMLALLARGIAHDFNNVLAAISGCLHVVERVVADPLARDYLARGHRGVERAGRLVQQLLCFGSASPDEVRTLPARDAFTGSLELLRVAAGPSVDLRTSGDSRWLVRVDPRRLEMALLNLAVNARDAMPRGGVLRVTLSDATAHMRLGGAALPDEHVLITVQDDGCGMTPEVLSRALEPFFTTKPAGRGTGLGLMMVDRFVREAGGRLAIDSAPGRGTTVTMALPRVPGEPPPSPPRAPETDATQAGCTARILLVDADEMLRPILARQLRERGHAVREAGCADEAWSLVAGGEPLDLLIADTGLPGRSGTALAADVRALHAALPVLLTSAGNGDAAAAADLDVEVLHKPFSAAGLGHAVAAALGTLPRAEQRMTRRIGDARLRAVYAEWCDRRAPHRLPSSDELDLAGCGVGDDAFVAEFTSLAPLRFCWLAIGRALQQALDGYLDGTGTRLAAGFPLGQLEEAYRRCIRRREASYESLRLRLDADAPLEFERLLLPCTGPDGLANRLVGVVIFRNLPDAASATIPAAP